MLAPGRLAAVGIAAVLAAVPPAARRGAAQGPGCSPPAAASPESLVAQGRYWHALRVLGPLPRSSRPLAPADAALRLAVAEALDQGSEADRIIARVRSLDTLPALLLLAARREEDAGRWADAAARYRRLASLPAASPAARAIAAVRLAVAYERLDRGDSAEAAWRRAARLLPPLADWFALRRAAFETDTTLAFASVAAMRSPGAAARADDFVAGRRVAAGNLGGALAVYRRRGRLLDAARLEVTLGHRETARRIADSVLAADPSRPAALLAANLIAATFPRPTPVELVGMARAYRARGDLATAERYARRAALASDTSVAAWTLLADVATARHRFVAAHAALDSAAAPVRHRASPPPDILVPARVRLLGAEGRWPEAAALVTRLADTGAGDSVAVAALLVARHDRLQDSTGAELAVYRLLVERFADTPPARFAALRLALASYAAGARDTAAADLAGLLARGPTGRLLLAARYWNGRLELERHDPAAAGDLAAVAQADPTGYYGVRARELLGEPLRLAAPPADTAPGGGLTAAEAAERIRLLALVGLANEARAEVLGWAADSTASPRLLAAASAAAAASGLAPQAILLGQAARARGGLTPAVAAALFPLPYRAVLEAEAAEDCLDPLLLAAIVRQESHFNPDARSAAGARGLSQLLPVTAREMSRRLRIRPFDERWLEVPDFNLHFGARYLRDRVARGALPLAVLLASYNAGPRRIAQWKRWPGYDDPDLFIAELPIAETSDYVGRVFAAYAWYHRLYGASGAPPRVP